VLRRLLLFTTSLIISSCGWNALSTTTTEGSLDRGEAVVVANEYSFTPAVLAVEEAQSLELRNSGGLAHTWTVLADPIESEADLPGAEVITEARVDVGQSALTDLASIPPGTYQVICTIPGHFSAGMEGELVIGS
jgi:uncharacterized cupredoxin-like copper-binding protein